MRLLPYTVAVVALMAGLSSVRSVGAAPTGTTKAVRDVTDPVAQGDKPRTVALTVAPLSAAIGRYGGDVHVVVAPHHGFGINLHFDSARGSEGVSGETLEAKAEGQGAELAYRIWGGKGPSGFFIGPSLVLARHSVHTEMPGKAPENLQFSHLGWALDMGYQAIYDNGLVLGFGIGVQHAVSSKALPELPLVVRGILGEGWLPRALLSFGFAG